eukprot:CAMPEP_0180532986 /NCGR_PEP_ID=MMETSP1036_2-20121128/63357_1 /TAXON_ID=632150 /ORGANISM="Azadinium spinosum, Strain 3D9" /LENGTH=67 /DNA_ID=CAMNT_0022547115 /DNA_START=60 /DNA_END=260 /DNA_ORIENTATION=-
MSSSVSGSVLLAELLLLSVSGDSASCGRKDLCRAASSRGAPPLRSPSDAQALACLCAESPSSKRCAV